MQITSQILTGLTTETGWVILSIDNTQLTLPGAELVSIELHRALELETDEDTGIVAWLNQADKKWPVYCVNGDLALLSMIPAGRSFSIFIKHDGAIIGLLCDRVRKLPPEDLLLAQKLPLCLHHPQSPVEALALVDNEPTGIISAAALANYLTHALKTLNH